MIYTGDCLEHLDLFSGIGGFALAARQNGIETVQFVEIDERCRTFLSRAWPGVAIHDDIRTFRWNMADGEEIRPGCRSIAPEEGRQAGRPNQGDPNASRPVFLLTGGVPCQPASRAGKQRGAEDDRWLWPEAIRILGEVKPTWAVFENPPGIGDVGLAGILSDVEAQGYEVRVFGVPACAIGAPHIRERYFIVANRGEQGREGSDATPRADGLCSEYASRMANASTGQDNLGRNGDMAETERCRRGCDTAAGGAGEHLADPIGCGCRSSERTGECETTGCGDNSKINMGNASDCSGRVLLEHEQPGQSVYDFGGTGPWSNFVWLPCADGKVRRAPDDSFGLVDGLHRSLLGALGNSIVPQVAEEIIGAIMEAEISEKRIEAARLPLFGEAANGS